MAAIAGIFGNDKDKKTTERMLNSILHRGPDTYKIYQKIQLTAGVISSDLSVARGDGFAQDGEIAVFFDGEIYNKRDQEKSDACIVLELYKQYGRTFPAYLEGVFACAVYDGQDFILARDPVGVRPLYWGKVNDGGICFASEMKALVDIVQEVAELLPSTTFSANSGLAGYLPQYPEIQMHGFANEAITKLPEYLTKAVAKRLDDNAVGACLLSGGLDSSIIAAVANELKPGLPVLTVGTEGSPDLKNAVLMAEHLGMEHHIFTYDAEQIKEIIPKAVWALESFDEDCVSGAISNLFASAFAGKFTNCILSGEGGDELFGGYHLLKDLPTESQRLKMMERLIEIAYNTALQRLDRSMMANSINYRTPFIDTDVIAFASQIPVQWKIHNDGNGRLIEKWILREAFKDMLPKEIYLREKLRFSAGTGTDNLMDDIAKNEINDDDFNEASRNTIAGYYLNSPKELWYYNIFREKFPSVGFEKLVGRWDPGK